MDARSPASLSGADINFIQDVQDTIRRDIAKGHDYGGLLTEICLHLECFQEASISVSALERSPSWGRVVCSPDSHPAKDKNVIRITGPFSDDLFEATTVSFQQRSEIIHYVSALDVVCRKLEEIRNRSLIAIQKQQGLEREKMGLRQTAETTIDDHIRLLRQYNRMKDVGQQLIGIVAESRNVPIGTVYKDGDYGVCAED